MVGTVANCKKCNKIFQQYLQPICPECIKLEEEQFTVLYRALQKSASEGGIDIDNLAEQVGVSVEDIEKLYMEGRLSTAGLFLKTPCQGCGVLCGEKDRKGRYCLKCSEITATKAGVEVKSMHELKKEEDQEQKNHHQPPPPLPKKSSAAVYNGKEPSRFGFVVRH